MNEKLNILELIDSLAEKHGMSKKNAESFVREFFQLIEETLENDKYVKVKGLGTFKLIDVERRESVNVNTGERFEIQGHTKVSFTPDPTLKETVNKPFSHFETVVLNESTVLDDTPVVEEEKKPASTEYAVFAEEDNSVAPASDMQNPDAPVEESDKGPFVEIAERESVSETDEKESPNQEEKTGIEEQKELQEDVEKAKAMQEKKEYSSTMKYFIGIVVFVVLLCAGAVLFMYYPDWFDGTPSGKEEEETTILQDTVESGENRLLPDERNVPEPMETQADGADSQPVVTDTVIRDTKVLESVQVNGNGRKVPATGTKPEEATEPVSPLSSSSVYEISGLKTTHTVSQGETLTRISLKYYGTKELWSYIVKYNPQIKNPDNVPYGTKLKIPELVKK